jgi:uncharacterized protein GlcG (DUF336 family)
MSQNVHSDFRLRAAACAGTAALFVACSGSESTGPDVATKQSPFPEFATVQSALRQILTEQNGGLGFQMWATIVDRTGAVVTVTFSGEANDDQWPGSRAISAQKANTGNAFSLDGFALSSANLYAAVQPGGSLFGLQESNPVDPNIAYAGKPADYGTPKDPMVGKRLGGINVFGGGLALYDQSGALIGGIGLSGDTSCTDHIIAWKLRHALNLDNVPAGPAPDGSDNIIYDTDGELTGFEHPQCFDLEGRGSHVQVGNDLPTTHPIGPGA